jgi:Domain of unknown function (DUF4105)
MKLKLYSFFFFFIGFLGYSQQFPLSPNAEVSVLTVGPGESLNDAFGHNAFRIKDSQRGLDVVFGYGEYDFDAPNFYLKFAQGKLNYLISKNNFSNFYRFYIKYDRTIKEQRLNLSYEERQRLYDYLLNNFKPENRKYLYDFFYDNCATRIRDVTEIATKDNISFLTPNNFEPKTFRTLIHEHVGLNSWGSFGIDIALGSIIDREATPYEHMFLPKYIHGFFENATLTDTKNLVNKSTTIYKQKKDKLKTSFFLSPLLVMGLLASLILYITYRDFKNKTRSKWLDTLLFILTGLIGVIVFLLWFATDHTATGYNYNMLWAFPLNLLMIGQIYKKDLKNWFKAYLKFLLLMLILMTLHWLIGVQIFSIALIPILIALIVRWFFLLQHFQKA